MAKPDVDRIHKDIDQYYNSELEDRGVSRRSFIKFCTVMAASLAMPFSFATSIAKAVTSPRRPPVIWLHFQDCTACTETLLRTFHPKVEDLVLDIISLDYSETLMAGAGHQAEAARRQSIEENAGNYILVVEGSIPTKDDGIYCKVAGKTALEHLKETVPGAAALVAIGSCATWGGIPSSKPDPTGAKGLSEIYPDKTVINLPGCPPNGYNLLQTIVYYLTLKKLPDLTSKSRPKFAYGTLIHENCERRPHFDNGRFAERFGDSGHLNGWCLYKLGCKGPETYNNCPAIGFDDAGARTWPVGTGHPCFGCSEEDIAFTKPLFQQASVVDVTPPALFPRITEEEGKGVTTGAAALAGAVIGGAAGAAAMMAKRLKEQDEQDEQLADNKKSEE